MTERLFAAVVARSSIDAIRLALEHVETEAGALRIYRAEARGRRRLTLLITAERRIQQLRGQEAPGLRTQLMVTGAWTYRSGS